MGDASPYNSTTMRSIFTQYSHIRGRLLFAALLIAIGTTAASPEDAIVPEGPMQELTGDAQFLLRMGDAEAKAMSTLMLQDSTILERVRAMETNFLAETSSMGEHSMAPADITKALKRVALRGGLYDFSTCKCFHKKKLDSCFALPMGGRPLCDDIQLKLKSFSGNTCHYKFWGFKQTVSCGASGTYQHFARACVIGNNLAKYTSKTVQECEALCNERTDCKGFEYGVNYGGKSRLYQPGSCQLSKSAGMKGCNGSYYNLDFYRKSSAGKNKGKKAKKKGKKKAKMKGKKGK